VLILEIQYDISRINDNFELPLVGIG